MRVLFVGPSLHGASPDLTGIERRDPARQGDVLRAVLGGASVIGLVDGYFGEAASVWHKEILYALSQGVRVLGASSLGALRAAECAAFGMEPVGPIAHAYCRGRLVDDDAVALTHGPRELDFMPLTEPLVDALATLGQLWRQGLITSDERRRLAAAAHAVHFTRRDSAAIVAAAFAESTPRAAELERLYATHRVSRKQADALLLVERLRAARAARVPPGTWEFAVTPMWAAKFADMTA